MSVQAAPMKIRKGSHDSISPRGSPISLPSDAVSASSSFSQQSLAAFQRRSSKASSLKSISTRETCLSVEHSVGGMASPTSSVKSGRRHSRPRVLSIAQSTSSGARQDAVDPLAFHRRSTQLFPASPISIPPRHPGRSCVKRTATSPESSRPQTARISRTITQSELPTFNLAKPAFYQQPLSVWSTESLDEEALVAEPVTIHWTSDETRRREYADIDKSRRGLRGIWNKVAPKFARTGTNSRFYDEKDGSDVGSVRRFRLDMSSADK